MLHNSFLRVTFFLSFLFFITGCASSQYAPANISYSENSAVNQYSDSRINPALISRSKDFDLVHTKLDLSLNWQDEFVFGKALLQLKPYFYEQDILELDAKLLSIQSIDLLTPEGKQHLEYSYDGLKLIIELDRVYRRGELFQIEIEYRSANRKEVVNNAVVSDQRGFYFIDPHDTDSLKPTQFWTQGETEHNSRWFPTIDAPNEKTTQELLITIEDKFLTLSNGVKRSSSIHADGTRTDHWVLDSPHSAYLFSLIVGEFSVTTTMVDDIPLEYAVEKEYSDYAKDIFKNTPEMIRFFSTKFNYPFPWPKYSQVAVRDFVAGAMENTTVSTFMEDVQVDSRTLKDYNWDYIIAHELTHQWFGDLVTCESWSNLALNEGFAEYGEYLWNEYKYGKDEADFQFVENLETYLEEAKESKHELIRNNASDPEDMFNAHSYQKAGQVIHMLRNFVGDEAFFESLSIYLKENEFASVEIEHLRLSFEKVTGQDLNWFFDQWFFTKGHPILNISHIYESDTLAVKFEQIQDFSQSTIFRLPLYMDIFLDSTSLSIPIILESGSEIYKLYLPERPKAVVINDSHLLAEVYHSKSQDEWANQYLRSENYVNREQAIIEVMSFDAVASVSSKMAIEKALRDSHHKIRQYALEYYTEFSEHVNEETLAQIISLTNDKNSDVKATALFFLANKDYKKYELIIKESLQDSSYLVLGTALTILLEYDLQYFEKASTKYQKLNDLNVIIPLATQKQSISNQYDWFISKLVRLRTADLFYFLQYFNAYLITASEAERERGVAYLSHLTADHHNEEVNLVAFQGLLFLSELPSAKSEIRKILNTDRGKVYREQFNAFIVEP
jgi:aminopeptidase N